MPVVDEGSCTVTSGRMPLLTVRRLTWDREIDLPTLVLRVLCVLCLDRFSFIGGSLERGMAGIKGPLVRL